MKKVFSVCLWGDMPIYNIGAIKNADLCLKYYPDFEYWIYIHKKSVPQKTINDLKNKKNVKIIYKDDDINNSSPMSWRFESIDDPDVEIMVSRDIDTRILEREVVATNEWIKSGKTFHIMRDHPHHKGWPIYAGLFGTRKIKLLDSWKKKLDEKKFIKYRTSDQDFLKDYIYPLIKDKCIIHDNFFRKEKHCEYFTTKYNSNCDFVGMYVNPDESRSERYMKIIQEEVDKLKKKYILINIYILLNLVIL